MLARYMQTRNPLHSTFDTPQQPNPRVAYTGKGVNQNYKQAYEYTEKA